MNSVNVFYNIVPFFAQTVSVAAQEGIDLKTKECIYQWSYIQSVFFASTILTTIGNWPQKLILSRIWTHCFNFLLRVFLAICKGYVPEKFISAHTKTLF